MRWLRDFETVEKAQRWADVLLGEDIECTLRQSPEGRYAVWVHDDDRLEAARALVREFVDSPGSPRFEEMAEAGRQRRRQATRDQTSRRPPVVNMRGRFGSERRAATVTMILIGISLVAAFLTRLGQDELTRHYLFIEDMTSAAGPSLLGRSFVALGRGEVWRLISPVFLHFGILHLVFNLWWLMDFGGAIERVFSPWYLLACVLTIGVVSNLAEYLWTGNPVFGGMSGVIYGLFGFLWLRGRFDAGFPLQISSGTAGVLLVWYAVCLAGLVGHVANTAHTAGLVVGMAWGAISSGRFRPSPSR